MAKCPKINDILDNPVLYISLYLGKSQLNPIFIINYNP